MGETYYDVLGVAPDASAERVATAYRERVLETHPDRNDDPDAAEAFKRVCDAEAVLGDPIERARYDRLGHDAYRRLGSIVDETTPPDAGDGQDGVQRSTTEADASADSVDESAAQGDRSDRSPADSTTTTASSASGTGRERDAGRSRDDRHRRRSHHARHREWRRRRTARYVREGADVGDETGLGERTAGKRTDGDKTNGEKTDATGANRTAANGRANQSYTDGRSKARRAAGQSTGTSTRSTDFAVHGWTDDVELTPSYRDLDGQAVVTIGCLALLYPVLVVAAISPALPVVVNATVAGCTLLLIGYLLTVPRVAIAIFGTWSLVVPLVLSSFGPVAPTSGLGLVALGSCVTPLGYAIAVWWVLRP